MDKEALKQELVTIAEKYGVEPEEVVKEFKTSYAKSKDVEGALIAAESKVRTPSGAFMGMILCVAEAKDGMARKMSEAERKYAANKQLAISEGWTDKDGVPLDRRENVGGRKNKRFGKKLLSFWSRRIYAILSPVPADGDEPSYRIAVMSMTGQLLNVTPKVTGEGILTYGILKDSPDYRYVMNGSRKTTFKEYSIPMIEEVKEKGWDPFVAAIKGIIDEHEDAVISPDDMLDFVIEKREESQNKPPDWNFCAVTEGRIMAAYSYETNFGTQYRMILKESRLSETEIEVRLSETLWESCRERFGVGSKVFTLGNPSITDFYDREKGEKDPEIKVPVWYAEGMFPIPEFTVDPADSPIGYASDDDDDEDDADLSESSDDLEDL